MECIYSYLDPNLTSLHLYLKQLFICRYILFEICYHARLWWLEKLAAGIFFFMLSQKKIFLIQIWAVATLSLILRIHVKFQILQDVKWSIRNELGICHYFEKKVPLDLSGKFMPRYTTGPKLPSIHSVVWDNVETR